MGTFGDVDRRVEKAVRVRNYFFMYQTLRNEELDPNVVCETLELYVLSAPSSTGGPWRPRA